MENNNTTEKIIVRLPPSPTGKLHSGNMRSLLMNYIFAKQNNGKIIFRSEDTDKERSKPEYEDYIKESFAWLGVTYDEFYRQSERTEIYKEYLEKLLNTDKAYWSDETPSEEDIAFAKEKGKELRTKVIRLRNTNQVITFEDIVLGEIKVDTTDLGDIVIAKDLESPLYHFTVVVDDGLMGVTHIIRGADHVSNTPRQIVMQEAFGFKRPQYIHLPLIVAADGKKLSKRHGDVSVLSYRDRGFLPEAMNNFLMLIGWNPGTDQEIFTMSELIEQFSLEKINKGAAVFNEEKFRWINKEHLKKYPDEVFLNEFKKRLSKKEISIADDIAQRFTHEIRERIHIWNDIDVMIDSGEVDFLIKDPELDLALLPWKKSTLDQAQKNLQHILLLVKDYEGDFNADSLKELIYPYAEENGKGDVLWPLRFALSGKEKSPDPFSLLSILGKEISLKRVQKAVEA